MAEENRTSAGKSQPDIWVVLKVVTEIAEFIMMLISMKAVKEAKPGDERKEAVMQHLPHLFGFGHADEGIWGSLRTELKENERKALDSIMRELPPDEAITFIITVASMPNEENTAEFSELDRRVMFLKEFVADANMCATKPDIESAIINLRANRMLAKNALQKIQKEVSDALLAILGIQSWNEFSAKKLSDAVESATNEIETFRGERRRQRSLFGWSRNLLDSVMKKFKIRRMAT